MAGFLAWLDASIAAEVSSNNQLHAAIMMYLYVEVADHTLAQWCKIPLMGPSDWTHTAIVLASRSTLHSALNNSQVLDSCYAFTNRVARSIVNAGCIIRRSMIL